MKRPWTATIALWVVGLVALPALVSGPSLLRQLAAAREIQPLAIIEGVLVLFSLLWLAALIWVAFQHRGRSRTIVLGVTAAAALTFGAAEVFLEAKPMSFSVDLPPPAHR